MFSLEASLLFAHVPKHIDKVLHTTGDRFTRDCLTPVKLHRLPTAENGICGVPTNARRKRLLFFYAFMYN